MKHVFKTAVFLAVATLVSSVGTVSGHELDVWASVRETKEAQQAARRFVERMQQTRDVSVLLEEMFLPDFVSHFASESEVISPNAYSRLTYTERLRFFTVLYNFAYLSTIVITSDHDDMDILFGKAKSQPKLLLPYPTILKLRQSVPPGDAFPLTSTQQVRTYLVKLESSLAEVQATLRRLRFEQSAAFQEMLNPRDDLGQGINYRVRAYVGGGNVKDCETLIGFSRNRKFFRIETPLLLGIIVVRERNRMKIVRITPVDGD